MRLRNFQAAVVLVIFSLLGGIAWSQNDQIPPVEALTPLSTNHTLVKEQQRNLDDTYIYFLDTVRLPFLDDFSTDRFTPYDAMAGDANVSDTLFIQLWDITNSIVLTDTNGYMIDTTYTVVFADTGASGDTVEVDRVPNPSMQILEYDICNYPVTFDTVEVWPPYEILDSSLVNVADIPDTIKTSPDLEQDSATIHFVFADSTFPNYVWQDNGACRNSRYPIDPPTVGVATMDGLDENGYPYDFSHAGNGSEADLLTSKSIDMSGYVPGDSLGLSFFYETTGLGDEPEFEDSLLLEFWVVDSNRWDYVWSDTGHFMDSFNFVFIRINDPIYMKNGFKFRFTNYGTLSGNLDHWHLDYVYLDSNRINATTTRDMNDVAFMYESYGLLREYTAMPWHHYKWNPANYMVDTSNVVLYNTNPDVNVNFFSPLGKMKVKMDGVEVDSATMFSAAGQILAISKDTVITDLLGMEYDTTLAGTDTCATFTVCHYFESTTSNSLVLNDTIRYQQEFSNYYAYDDGTAEAAYGLFGVGHQVAYQFDLEEPDTLRSVQFHWSPSVNDATQSLFRLTVWNDLAGEPGNVLYQTDALFAESPKYSAKKNGFVDYFMYDSNQDTMWLSLGSGTYYVGWTKVDQDRLNVGFDRNVNKQSRIFHNALGFWTNTSFEGALMVRPVFKSDKDAFLSVSEQISGLEARVYPNPTDNVLYIDVDPWKDVEVELRDLGGRLLNFGSNVRQLNMADLPSGVYLVRITDATNGQFHTSKVIKR